MPKMKQEICLGQFEPGGRAQMAMRRGFADLRGTAGFGRRKQFRPYQHIFVIIV
jgi:hypothetical protein